MVSHDTATMRVDRADPSEIAGRMAASGSYELLPLMSAYFAYRSAFPGRRNELLEHAGIIKSETLEHIIGRKAAYVVRHAYPCDLQGLRQVMAPMCSSDPALLSHESSGQRFAAATVMARTSHG